MRAWHDLCAGWWLAVEGSLEGIGGKRELRRRAPAAKVRQMANDEP
jgi:hypothetical protein